MESHFEINVAQRTGERVLGRPVYSHLFATAPRSGITERDVRRVLAEIGTRFPAPEFHVSVTQWEGRGTELDLQQLLSHKE